MKKPGQLKRASRSGATWPVRTMYSTKPLWTQATAERGTSSTTSGIAYRKTTRATRWMPRSGAFSCSRRRSMSTLAVSRMTEALACGGRTLIRPRSDIRRTSIDGRAVSHRAAEVRSSRPAAMSGSRSSVAPKNLASMGRRRRAVRAVTLRIIGGFRSLPGSAHAGGVMGTDASSRQRGRIDRDLVDLPVEIVARAAPGPTDRENARARIDDARDRRRRDGRAIDIERQARARFGHHEVRPRCRAGGARSCHRDVRVAHEDRPAPLVATRDAEAVLPGRVAAAAPFVDDRAPDSGQRVRLGPGFDGEISREVEARRIWHGDVTGRTVEAHGRVGVARQRPGYAECHPAIDGTGARARGIGRRRPARLAQSPVAGG